MRAAITLRILLLAAVLAPAGHARAQMSEPAAPLDLEGWVELASPNITLVTHLESQRAIGLLQSLEAQRALITDRISGWREAARLPTTVVLFGDEASYAPFRLVDREGQFFSNAVESFVVVNGGSDLRPLSLAAAHEYSHALMAERGRWMPLWLHEGLADYYSTFRLLDDRFVVGAAVPGHRSALRNHAFLPFAELAAIGGRSLRYHGDDSRRFYAQSWLTVHYLLSDPESRQRLAEGLDRLDSRGDPAGDLDSILGAAGRPLEDALREYLNRPVLPSFVIDRPAGFEVTTPCVRSLSSAEMAYRLGLVALEQARWSEVPERFSFARELFEAAIAGRPRDGDAYAGLARLEAVLGRSGSAEQLFERAVYLDALEPRSYAHYADFLLAAPEDGAQARWRRGRAGQMLRRALELEPGHSRLRERLEELANVAVPGPAASVGDTPNPPR